MENGKAAITRGLTNGLGFGSTEFHVLRPNGAAIPEYLYHYIRQESFREAAEGSMAGVVGQLRVPARFLEEASIPLPPLAEQRRIVAQVEALLTRTTAARDRLMQVSAILKRLRQAVLVAACSGRLTEDWRPDDPDSGPSPAALDLSPERPRTHTGSKSQSLQSDSPPELPDTWRIKTLGELLAFVTSGSRGWARYYSANGAVFVRSQDINTDQLVLEGVAHVTPPVNAETQRTRVRRGDMLVTITGANVTKTATVEAELDEAYVSQHVALVRLIEPELRHYLHLWLVSTEHGRGQLRDATYGAGKPGLNLDNIRQVAVALPPLEEQQEIVRRVEALFALVDKIEQRVTAATRRAEKLTQSILARSFRGELVPTEAELALREGREYEPATVLLERIRDERASSPSRQRQKRRGARQLSLRLDQPMLGRSPDG